MNLNTAYRLFAAGGLRALIAHLKIRSRIRVSDRAMADVHKLSQLPLSAKEKFSRIYKEKLWVKAGLVTGVSDSLSGHGSSLASTNAVRQELERFIVEKSIRLLFDAPCGDFHWMRHVRMPADCDYLGGDIVENVVHNVSQEHSRRRGPDSGARSFMVLDITADEMPQADVWLCKDCLQHLSYKDVASTLRNFTRSGIPLALITNHQVVGANQDIPTGGFRFLDLCSEPFNLPLPMEELKDASVDAEPKVLALWTREQIKAAVER